MSFVCEAAQVSRSSAVPYAISFDCVRLLSAGAAKAPRRFQIDLPLKYTSVTCQLPG
jgi:hypothetical protein